ncbi:UNKNOWN [Stylonychia lemnae]|uniref:Uncharacterized protein n=1 Tax=Stylonychia lemnae TaxID=5949 RepID=A0A078AEN8_STYLE|nr:UNKNOWN [Stylonychia lemnae]|eukprot:CDW79942.1 UNKNOWN [Stylonychia lemnae]
MQSNHMSSLNQQNHLSSQFSFQNTVNLRSLETFRNIQNQISNNGSQMQSQRNNINIEGETGHIKSNQNQFAQRQISTGIAQQENIALYQQPNQQIQQNQLKQQTQFKPNYRLNNGSNDFGNTKGCANAISPNLFHNPITSGQNSTKNASPMLNNTANFANISNNLQQKYSQLQSSNKTSLDGTSLKQGMESNHSIGNINIDLNPTKLGYNMNDGTSGSLQTAESQGYREKLQNLKAAQQQRLDSNSLNSKSQGNFKSQILAQQTQNTIENRQKLSSPVTRSPNSDFSSQGSQRKSTSKLDMKLYREHKEKQRRLEQMQQQKAEQEKNSLQKKPFISPKSQKIAQSLNRNFMDNQNEFIQRKYSEQLRGQQMKDQQERQELRDRPQINPQSQAINRNLGDLMSWQQKKDAKMREMKIQHEMQEYQRANQELSKATHVTPGSQQYLQDRQHIPIEQRLLEYGQQQQQKMNYLRASNELNIMRQQSSPKISQNSEKIMGEKLKDTGYQKYTQSKLGLMTKSPTQKNLGYQQVNMLKNKTDLQIRQSASQHSLSPQRNHNFTQNNELDILNYKQDFNAIIQKQPMTTKNGGQNSIPRTMNQQSQKSLFKNELRTSNDLFNLQQQAYKSLYEKTQEISNQPLEAYDQSLNLIQQKIQKMPSTYEMRNNPNVGSKEQITSLDNKNKRILDMILDNETQPKQIQQISKHTSNAQSLASSQFVNNNCNNHITNLNSLQNTGHQSQNLMTQKSISNLTPIENNLNSTMQSGISLLSSGLYQNPNSQKQDQNDYFTYQQIANNSNSRTRQMNFQKSFNTSNSVNSVTSLKTLQYNNTAPQLMLQQRQLLQQQQQQQEPQVQQFNGKWKDLSVIQRNEIWMNNKKRKIDSAREEMKDKDIVGCTFEPKLTQYKPPRPHSRSKIGDNLNDSKNEYKSVMNRSHNMSQGNISREIPREHNRSSSSYAQIHEKKQCYRSRSFDNLNNQTSGQSLHNQSRYSSQKRLNEYSDNNQDSDQTPVMAQRLLHEMDSKIKNIHNKLQDYYSVNDSEPIPYQMGLTNDLQNAQNQEKMQQFYNTSPLNNQSRGINSNELGLNINLNKENITPIQDKQIDFQYSSNGKSQNIYQQLVTKQLNQYPVSKNPQPIKTTGNDNSNSRNLNQSHNSTSASRSKNSISGNNHNSSNYVPLSQRIAKHAIQNKLTGKQQDSQQLQTLKPAIIQNQQRQTLPNQQELLPAENNLQKALPSTQSYFQQNQFSGQITHSNYQTQQRNHQEQQQQIVSQQPKFNQTGSDTIFSIERPNQNNYQYNNVQLNQSEGYFSEQQQYDCENPDKFKEKLNKAKETLARIRQATKQF